MNRKGVKVDQTSLQSNRSLVVPQQTLRFTSEEEQLLALLRTSAVGAAAEKLRDGPFPRVYRLGGLPVGSAPAL